MSACAQVRVCVWGDRGWLGGWVDVIAYAYVHVEIHKWVIVGVGVSVCGDEWVIVGVGVSVCGGEWVMWVWVWVCLYVEVMWVWV